MQTLNEAKNVLLPELNSTAQNLIKKFDEIPADRKSILLQLTEFIEEKVKAGQPVYLNFICTHNSRRSHLAQVWAQAAAHTYRIPRVRCFSGGTEATAFNPKAVKALQDAGFSITKSTDGENPVYDVAFSETAPALKVFSKTYDDPFNHKQDFAAVMTCSDADENCPFVSGAEVRIALTYDDPKNFDGTPQEAAKYKERVEEIGREILYAFANVKR
jgi:arsenate reductase (thioredoxin)